VETVGFVHGRNGRSRAAQVVDPTGSLFSHDIRYVCVSDLHLGALNSVLTNVASDGNHTSGPAPMLDAVLDAPRLLIWASGTTTPPTLVVHGDLFEAALTTMDNAADTFGQLVTQAWGDSEHPLFANQVLYVPANHDHHMWELTRERQFEDHIRAAPDKIHPMEHVTPMMPELLPDAQRDPLVEVLGGHANSTITLDLYTQVVDGMHDDAASKVASLISRTTLRAVIIL